MIKKLAAIFLIILSGPLQAHEGVGMNAINHALAHASDPIVVSLAIGSVALIALTMFVRKNKSLKVNAGAKR